MINDRASTHYYKKVGMSEVKSSRKSPGFPMDKCRPTCPICYWNGLERPNMANWRKGQVQVLAKMQWNSLNYKPLLTLSWLWLMTFWAGSLMTSTQGGKPAKREVSLCDAFGMDCFDGFCRKRTSSIDQGNHDLPLCTFGTQFPSGTNFSFHVDCFQAVMYLSSLVICTFIQTLVAVRNVEWKR